MSGNEKATVGVDIEHKVHTWNVVQIRSVAWAHFLFLEECCVPFAHGRTDLGVRARDRDSEALRNAPLFECLNNEVS